MNLHRDAIEHAALGLGDDVNQLDAAGAHRGEKRLDGSDLLTRAAVLHWPIYNEVMITGAAEDASEDIG